MYSLSVGQHLRGPATLSASGPCFCTTDTPTVLLSPWTVLLFLATAPRPDQHSTQAHQRLFASQNPSSQRTCTRWSLSRCPSVVRVPDSAKAFGFFRLSA